MKFPEASVEVTIFWPVAAFAAETVTPGRGTLPERTTPEISPAGGTAPAGDCAQALVAATTNTRIANRFIRFSCGYRTGPAERLDHENGLEFDGAGALSKAEFVRQVR